jgi:hypothetical protein
MKETYKNYHNSKFFKHTFCEFKLVSNDFFVDHKAHYKSKSGSSYFYTDAGVFRYSNHWGRVANCRWNISGISNYKNQNYYVGYANWADFYPLNNPSKSFYLEVNTKNGETTLHKYDENDTTSHFLMTLEFAQTRMKQIRMLFKDYKWALYYQEDIANVRAALITKLINSDVPLQKLKQELKNDFL